MLLEHIPKLGLDDFIFDLRFDGLRPILLCQRRPSFLTFSRPQIRLVDRVHQGRSRRHEGVSRRGDRKASNEPFKPCYKIQITELGETLSRRSDPQSRNYFSNEGKARRFTKNWLDRLYCDTTVPFRHTLSFILKLATMSDRDSL